jgi:hypothetical protein
MSLSRLNGLQVIERVILSAKKTMYICKCREDLCQNHIKVRPSNRHDGYCRSCANGHKRKRPYEALYNCFITSATNNQIAALIKTF